MFNRYHLLELLTNSTVQLSNFDPSSSFFGLTTADLRVAANVTITTMDELILSEYALNYMIRIDKNNLCINDAEIAYNTIDECELFQYSTTYDIGDLLYEDILYLRKKYKDLSHRAAGLANASRVKYDEKQRYMSMSMRMLREDQKYMVNRSEYDFSKIMEILDVANKK